VKDLEADLDKLVGYEIKKNRDIDLLRHSYRNSIVKKIDNHESATAFGNLETDKNQDIETPRPFFETSLKNQAQDTD
jgi:hypothetical protein